MRILSRPPDPTLDPHLDAVDRAERLLLAGLTIALALLIGAESASARVEAPSPKELRQSTRQAGAGGHGATPMGISVPLPPPS